MIKYITFKPGNRVQYGQDRGVHRGVPAGVRFEVSAIDNRIMRLVAPGYGDMKGRYGNGAIYVFLYQQESQS